MEQKRNLSFGKAGNGLGVRLILSIPGIKKLGLSPENKEVNVLYEDDKIIITPVNKKIKD